MNVKEKPVLEARVKLAELGLTVAEVEARGVEVAPDWQGDMSVSVEDAAPVHAEIQAATVAHEALWAAHVAAGRAWQADRSAAIAEAGEAAGRAARDGSHGARLGATQTALQVDGVNQLGVEASGFIAVRGTGEFAGIAGEVGDQGIGVIATSGLGGQALVADSVHGPSIWAESDDGVTLCLIPAIETGPPTTEYPEGSMRVDVEREVWLCVESGEPGTWTRLLREDTAPGRVIPITPVRVLDTRVTGGQPAGSPAVPGQKMGPLKGGTGLTLDLAGAGPIPASAQGVVGNLTVVLPTYAGYLVARPSGTASTTSALNFPAGAIVANAFTSQLGPDGLTLSASGTSANSYHLVIDIAAYIT